ncbi:MAG: C25 family cysteine peptidase [Thermoplasmatota archaeon]
MVIERISAHTRPKMISPDRWMGVKVDSLELFGRAWPSSAAVLFVLLTAAVAPFSIPIGSGGGTFDPPSEVRSGMNLSGIPIGLDLPEIDPEYVIICPGDFKEEMKPLAAHRTRLGLPSRIYTLESIGENFTGIDIQQKVHNFLRLLHTTYPSFQWLLLVGDSEYLMPRDLWHYAHDRGQPFGNNYTTDVYFAGLDSDWDGDGDGRFGELSLYGEVEGDLDWDIFVGRLPASTETEAANYANKLIRYEKNPPIGSWMGRFCNWGSLMEPPNLNTSSEYRYVPHRSNAYKVCVKVEEFLPDHLEVQSLYDYPQLEGGNYTPDDGRDTLNRGNMLSAFNAGASMINFAGQARYEAYALNDYGPPTGNGYNFEWNEPLTYLDDDIFTNQDMMPFMYASTCDTANFFNLTKQWSDKSLETWLTSPSGGIVGLISSTGISARGEEPTTSWGNWYLDEQFWKLFFLSGETRPGRALYLLKEKYEDEWFSPTLQIKESVMGMIYAYIMLGDPFVDVYTAPAERFVQDPSELKLYTGAHMLRFQVKDRNLDPVPNPVMTIYNGDLYVVLRGNAQGWINGTVHLGDAKMVNVSLRAHNMVPEYFTRAVQPAISDLSISLDDLTIDPPHPAPGTTANFNLTVRNLGGMDAEDVTLRILRGYKVEEPKWDPLLEDISIEILPAGSSYLARWNWTAKFGIHNFEIYAYSSSPDLDPYNQEIGFMVENPAPEFQFLQGTGLIKPAAELPPGVDATIDYDIYNNGTAAGSLQLHLYTGAPQAEGSVLLGTGTTGSVRPGSWINGSISFKTPNGTHLLHLVMDPDGQYADDMKDEPARSLLVVNHPPRWLADLSLTMLEDSGPAALNLSDRVADDDDSIQDLEFSVSFGEKVSCSVAVENTSAVLYCTPEKDWFGNTTVEVSASDGISTVTTVASVTVVGVNDPPFFPDTPEGRLEFNGIEDIPLTIQLKAEDPEGDALTFEMINGGLEIDPVTGIIEWLPDQEDVGTNEFRARATDEGGAYAEMTLVITIAEVNEPPVVAPVPDMEIEAGRSATFKLNVTDEEDDTLSFSSNSAMLRFDDDGTVHIDASGIPGGIYPIRISIFDGLHSTNVQFNLTVLDAGDGGKDNGEIDLGSIAVGIAIAVGVISVLVVIFLMFRRKDVDEMVREELDEADQLYYEDMEALDLEFEE